MNEITNHAELTVVKKKEGKHLVMWLLNNAISVFVPLAVFIITAVIEETDQNNLGMRVGDKLVVIRATAMPAVLVEGGFLTTPDEMERLADAAFLDTLAAGIAKGILENTLSELK